MGKRGRERERERGHREQKVKLLSAEDKPCKCSIISTIVGSYLCFRWRWIREATLEPYPLFFPRQESPELGRVWERFFFTGFYIQTVQPWNLGVVTDCCNTKILKDTSQTTNHLPRNYIIIYQNVFPAVGFYTHKPAETFFV